MILPRRTALPALAAALAIPGGAMAQPVWPERQIRWIIGFPPAGTADILSRILGERISQQIGQPVVVENRAGAGSTIAANLVAQARGDRHMVLLNNVSHAMSPALFPNVGYDPFADFNHIAILGALPMVIAVNPAFPAQDIQAFLAAARSQGNRLALAYGGNATASHLVGISFMRAARIEPTFVPYRGAGPALTDVLAGNVPAIIETLPAAIGHIRAGRLRALAVSSPARSVALPDLPNFAELGLGEATAVNWFNFFLPTGLPPLLQERWLAELRTAIATPEVRRRFQELGLEGTQLEPAAAAALVRAEVARWRDVVRTNNIQPD
ncbi:MAG: tripartite tricarboxylate transporter substrate binding protein [Roseococcus sp.]|nr:tripartite tricarboxylate transporter substrate binding protein [Roseococcus sp.]